MRTDRSETSAGTDRERENDQAGALDTLFKELTPLEPDRTSEATFLTKYVWPLMRLVTSDNALAEIDTVVFKGQQRPDIVVSRTKSCVKQTICQIDLKTKWAHEPERQKEAARVIEKVMLSYRNEVAQCHKNLDAPKLAVTIQGTTTINELPATPDPGLLGWPTRDAPSVAGSSSIIVVRLFIANYFHQTPQAARTTFSTSKNCSLLIMRDH
ncbi:hypothetical protein HDU86_003841 [Geranomyces michiganensis]|nr:hypothetical protein HDU86_003841 [Geranomyces michiganensis]